MAKIRQIICLIILSIIIDIKAQNIITGAERVNKYLPLITNKQVAIVGNQTSMINDIHLVDSLISYKINITKVFSPEHGFRGNEDAGALIKDDIDSTTKLPIISLYGKNKKPSIDDLKDVDIILFDIQDVGVRFYTYISTLHYVMEAAAENNVELIVLDRPNPNGHYIDGPVREEKYKSFVGMHPVPIVYGMTIGEYAQMINGEQWISQKCNLKVIKLVGYNHDSHYDLPIKPSPNLPNSRSINLYPSLCLFEGTNISVGRGTNFPFQHFGSPYIKSNYSFTPKSGKGSKFPKHENKRCYGTDLRFQENYMSNINLVWLINCYNECPNKEDFFNSFFDKLAGNEKLRKQIYEGKETSEIINSWEKDLNKFKKIRAKYLLYY
tara:strand:- start:4111 stop:5253 length:1143 start_codon:yes stop_codon:yes gene_type:complete